MNIPADLNSAGPAIKTAVDYLAAALEKGTWHQTGLLPSLKILAQSAGVSRNSMWKAVNVVKKQGALSVIEGGRIRIPGSKAVKEASEGLRWEKKKAQLASDILNGKYSHHGILPSRKELQQRYGVCHITLGKMLKSLAGTGIINLHKHQARIPSFSEKGFQSTVAVFTPLVAASKYSMGYEHTQDLIRELEGACSQEKIRMRVITYDPYTPDTTRAVINTLREDEAVVGYIFNMWWMEPEERMKNLFDAISQLSIHKKPLAILDNAGSFSQSRLMPGRLTRVFATSSRSSGAAVGRLLLGLGHKQIAYVSIWHGFKWSIDRLNGLVDVYESAGLKGNVHSFTEAVLRHTYDPFFSLLDADPDSFRKIFRPGYSADEYAEMFRSWERLRNNPLVLANRESLRIIQDFLSIKKLLSNQMEPSRFCAVRNALFDSARNAALEIYHRQIFNKVMNQKEISAWVCSSDTSAVLAQDFLKDKGVKLPENVSVASFDNSLASFQCKLTSFDFSLGAVTRRMLRFVFQPRIGLRDFPEGKIEAEGVLVERESTGNAPLSSG
jgi:DNA-binding LacI/PurR family transcriptional regulator